MDPSGDMLKSGQGDAGCQEMNVVDLGNTTGDNKYGVRIRVGGQGHSYTRRQLSWMSVNCS